LKSQTKKKEYCMKTKTEYYNKRRVTIIQEASLDLDDDIPSEIEFDLSTKKKNPFFLMKN
jgi:hypothetical protein